MRNPNRSRHDDPWRDGGSDDRSANGYHWVGYQQAGVGGYKVDEDHESASRGDRHYHDDYLHWRAEQIGKLDEDYTTWQLERRQKFSEDFDKWRNERAQRTGTRTGGGDTKT